MKTAMKELLEFVKYKINNDPATEYGRVYSEVFRQVKNEIEYKYLEAEKEQIIDASVQANLRYDTGANEPVLLRYCNDAEQYYQITFKPNE